MTGIEASVRTAAAADVPGLSRMLARAFHDDPVITWLFPDEAARLRRARLTFAVFTGRLHLPGGGVQVAAGPDGTPAAAALWDPPGQWRTPISRMITTVPAIVRAMGRRTWFGLRYSAATEKVHPTRPHWYLATLGTEPALQGEGLGSRLLRARLADCDRSGVPAYLESSKPANIGYYERFGFTVTGELTLPNGGPTIWPMWREP
ncbi:GNAT family N-acetyltransferase [Pseudonocardia bannensis]|uniref:GNAT family N-acetyltransferase n=1 Tax=Pseudonocardia bannensis TaxID=630973 RepID=A0A848DNT9_9PSEU|nr:GNAT family N-acetyltransferase [Pseudonocardia bannensis]NMH94467.1 GNAT family N-acetyltransferase [Pseudonocardia bannensis]